MLSEAKDDRTYIVPVSKLSIPQSDASLTLSMTKAGCVPYPQPKNLCALCVSAVKPINTFVLFVFSVLT